MSQPMHQTKPAEKVTSIQRAQTAVPAGRTLTLGPPAPDRQITPDQARYLQRTVGNQAVMRLLNRQTPVVQPKLMVGPVGDRYEQEADRIAAQVVNSPAPIQRHDEEEPPGMGVQRKPEELTPAIQRIQRRAVVGPEGGGIDGKLEARIRRSQSGGSPLPNSVRAKLEPKLAADFSRVKVHTGANAVQLNRELGAKAFTHGNHIYYGAGQSPTDLKLTAHEAVHVVQQGGAGTLQRKPVEAAAVVKHQAPARVQRFAYDDDPATWAPLSRVKRSGEGAEGVYFLFKGGSMIVAKPVIDPGNVEYANTMVERITGLEVPKTKVYPIVMPTDPGGPDQITAALTGTAIEGARSGQELTDKLRVSRYWLIMSTVAGQSIQMLGKESNNVQDAIDFITSQTALRDTGRIMVADAFLGNQDRLIGARVNLGNFFYRTDNDRAATIDNDAEVGGVEFRRNGDLYLSTQLEIYEALLDPVQRNSYINSFIAKFRQVQPGAVASINDDNVRQWVGEGITAALADMKNVFDTDMNSVRSAKGINAKYGTNAKRDYTMIKGNAQYMQARQNGVSAEDAKRKLAKYAKYKTLYNKLPKGLKWSAKIWNGGRGF